MASIQPRLEQARRSFLRGETAQAFAQYEQLLDIGPSDADVLLDYGRARYQNGDFEQAARLLERALAAQPDSLEAIIWLANAVWMGYGQEYGDAASLYRRAIQLAPEDPDGYIGLGMCIHGPPEAKKVPLDEGVAAFRKATELSPAREDAHFDLGMALIESGKVAAAIDELRIAAALRAQAGDQTGAEDVRAIIGHLTRGEVSASMSLYSASRRNRWPNDT